LVISVFLLIFISSVSYKHTQALTESTELLIHSYKIQIKLEQLISYIKDAETGQRGYIISKDSIFLQPYISAQARVRAPFNELKLLTSNNVQQYYNLDSLLVLINLRFALLARSLKLVSDPERDNKLLLDQNLIRGKNVMDLIRNQINKMIDLETTYFQDHQKKYAHELYFTPLSTLFLILISLIIVVVSFIKINYDLGVLQHANAELRLASESFKHAEEIGNFSSWQWNIDSNEYIFSDNQYSLLGVKPQSFKPTIANFLRFVHPDDRSIITEGVKVATDERKPSGAYFRIIKDDGELRYFKSIARLTEFHNKLIFIGINSDITEQHLSNIALEDRNHELEQSNTELASFNHIASHDLQEPLRKIQTFISRINDKESLNTGKNKEYFEKIQSSALRMRQLISDLLLFSRTTKAEKIFKQTDLNLLLDSALKELSPDIEETNAIIKTSDLPVLNVIPFQIQQLFTNLVGNSLKYSRVGITPEIKIDGAAAHEKELSDLKRRDQKKYYKISVSDNGMGFEQEHAEDIFILFYRLHPNTEFAGSGIGLAICKKIVENHGGFMIARGKPGVGSTFSFFLPA
jgi:signal transduction histidine kinase